MIIRRLIRMLVAVFTFILVGIPSYAMEPAQETTAEREERTEDDSLAEQTWNPEEDPAASSDGERPDASIGALNLTVKYTSGIKPKAGDTFDIVYQVVGSEASATISVSANEIDGYVGEIELPEAAYEVIDINYTGDREEIRTYCIENMFTVSAEEDGEACLIIGREGVFELTGKDGYFFEIGEDDMAEETPVDTDEDISDSKEGLKIPEIENPGLLRIFPAVIVSVVFGIGLIIAKKKGLLDR